MVIACEQCGKRSSVANMACGNCGEEFGFLSKRRDKWEPWDYSAWLFAQHWILNDRAEKDGFASLNEKQRTIVLVGALYYQIQNGGLHQFYANPTGDRSEETAAILKSIGAKKLATAFEAMNALFPSGAPSKETDARGEALDEIDEDKFEKRATKVERLAESVKGKDTLLACLVNYVGEALVLDSEPS